jgi:Zn-dependent membrane protease YugP
VERDASKRAVATLTETGWAAIGESQGVNRVLRSAALTYAANLGRRLAVFLFFVSIFVAAGGAGPV